MANKVIHIYGASGAGTTTLGKYISQQTGYTQLDTDDYFWEPTNPPYTKKRDKLKRLELMKKDIAQFEKVIISGSLVDWGDELIPSFTLAIRIETETHIRIERLKQREKAHFGSRIDEGGDMYEAHCHFLEWASLYDDGDSQMRSKQKHDIWQKQLKCPIIILDGNQSLEDNYQKIKKYL